MESREQALVYPVPEGYVAEVGADWVENIMYSIAGWFSANYGSGPFRDHATAYGGYLKLDAETGSFMGLLVDSLGFAKMEGMLSEDSMTYVKEYVCGFGDVTACAPITYTLKKVGDGYEGYFNFNQGGHELHGEAFCRIQPVVPNAYGVIHGLINGGV